MAAFRRRCGDCNSPTHNTSDGRCQCSKESLSRLSRVPSFDDWNDGAGNIRASIYYSPDSRQYVFLQNKKGYYPPENDGRVKYDVDVRKYTVLTLDELQTYLPSSNEFLDPRVQKYHVYGNSCRCNWSWHELILRVPTISKNLAIENAIIEVLRERSPRSYDQNNRAHIALTKGVVDHHDMDTTGGFLLGPIDVLANIADSFVRHQDINDEAHGLLAIPLSWLMLIGGKDEELLVPRIAEAATRILDVYHIEGAPFEIHFHLKEIKNQLDMWKSEWRQRASAVLDTFPFENFFDENSGFAILVTVTCFPDKTSFSVPAGKRELSETPWECFERECMEESGTDVSTSTARFRNDPDPAVRCSDDNGYTWQVVMHLQGRVNSYYLIHKSSEKLVSDALDRAAAKVSTAADDLGKTDATNDDSAHPAHPKDLLQSWGGWRNMVDHSRDDDHSRPARQPDPSQLGGYRNARSAAGGRGGDDHSRPARQPDPSQSGGYRNARSAAGGRDMDRNSGGVWSRGATLPIAGSSPVLQDGSAKADNGHRELNSK